MKVNISQIEKTIYEKILYITSVYIYINTFISTEIRTFNHLYKQYI